jgi:uncharacterized Tic20 family protein
MSDQSTPPPSEPSYTGPSSDGPTPPPGPPPGDPLPYASPSGAPVYNGPPPTADDRTWAMLSHLSGIFTSFVGPLIIWIVKKDQSPFVEDQAKEALNFQLTLLIGYAVAGITAFFCIGFLLAVVISVVAIIFGILGTMAANKGEAYRYPFNIRMVK